MSGFIVFLNGPIGVGKSSLGRALSARLGSVFLDGDDFAKPDLPWYACSLQTSRHLLRAGIAGVQDTGLAVIAYPLRCTNWIYFERRFGERGICLIVVTLRAAHGSILDRRRGRVFSDGERHRIQVMIEEGYGSRPFSDVFTDTDTQGFDATLTQLERDVRHLVER